MMSLAKFLLPYIISKGELGRLFFLALAMSWVGVLS